MHVTFLTQQPGWLGGIGVDLHSWGSGSILTIGMACGQCWNIDSIFP